METIENKVQKSGLIQLDLADFKPKQAILTFDIAEILWQGIVLKEKDFRQFVKEHDWSQYEGKAVGVQCSADAIVPTWAFMLITAKITEHGGTAIIGAAHEVEKTLIKETIYAFDLSEHIDGRFIIKGCADIAAPEYAMSELTKHLMKVAKSIMYGEPCSTVPVYKRPKV